MALTSSDARARPWFAWRPILTAIAVAILLGFWVSLQLHPFESDARAYYDANPFAGLYYGQWNLGRGFFYSPTFGQLLYPLTLLSWPAFYAVWTGLWTIAFAWLVSPVWAVALIAVSPMIRHGFAVANVNTFVLLAVVLAPRWPGLWSATLLTKVLPGVGLLWHLMRGEWRALAWAFGVTVLLVLPSLALTADLWVRWGQVLVASTASPPLPNVPPLPLLVRLPLAVAIIAFGARKGWWILAVAGMTLAIPNWRPEVTVVWAIAAVVHRDIAASPRTAAPAVPRTSPPLLHNIGGH